MIQRIRIGSRKSILARIQSYMVGNALQELISNVDVSYHFSDSLGDRDLGTPLWKMGSRGVFTKDLQEELISGNLDCLVHSWKDLDLDERSETEVLSVLPREDQRDVLLFKKNSFTNPKSPMVICTSSPRREYNFGSFFSAHIPKRLQGMRISFYPIRGNILTRIKTFLEGDFSGILIAKAAIDRILRAGTETFIPESEIPEIVSSSLYLRQALDHCLFCILPLSVYPNAPAQGGLAVEISRSNLVLQEIFSKLRDDTAFRCSLTERKILSSFGGGCHQKIGVAVREYPFGMVYFLRGTTDIDGPIYRSGIIQNIYDTHLSKERIFQDSTNRMKYSRDEIWPPGGAMVSRDRQRVSHVIPEDADLIVTRKYSLPDEFKQILDGRIVWTAGSETWRELSERDIWVHGSFDGLGEYPLSSDLEYIVNRKLNFFKLTHQNTRDYSFYPLINTYIIGDTVIPENFRVEKIRAAFWRSGSEFDFVTGRYPQLKKVDTYCGPGFTYRHLLEDRVIREHNNIQVTLSFSDWLLKYVN